MGLGRSGPVWASLGDLSFCARDQPRVDSDWVWGLRKGVVANQKQPVVGGSLLIFTVENKNDLFVFLNQFRCFRNISAFFNELKLLQDRIKSIVDFFRGFKLMKVNLLRQS